MKGVPESGEDQTERDDFGEVGRCKSWRSLPMLQRGGRGERHVLGIAGSRPFPLLL